MNSVLTLLFCSVVVLATMMTTMVSANSNGGSETCCVDMVPKHPVDPQRSAFSATGYSVLLDKNAITDSGVVHVTLQGHKPFKGYLLQVRDGDKAVGSFNIPQNDAHSKTINCFTKQQDSYHSTFHLQIDQTIRRFLGKLVHFLNHLHLPMIDFNEVFFRGEKHNNMATHNNAEDKRSVTVAWKPPKGVKKTYTVYATVAENGGIFWVRQPTAKITVH